MAESTAIKLSDPLLFKQKACQWAAKFGVFMAFDSCDYKEDNYSKFDWRLAVDTLDFISPATHFFEAVDTFSKQKKNGIVGFWGYDCQSETHGLIHQMPATVEFPPCFFFEPRYIFQLKGNELTLNRNYPETFEILEQIEREVILETDFASIDFVAMTSTQQYLANVEKIQERIVEGDFYELNYCTEVVATDADFSPISIFFRLSEMSKSPFSVLLKWHDKYALCASPERFVCMREDTLICQPIKGTVKRGANESEDQALQNELLNSPKERAENVMIVDLVRSDLTPFAETGSIKVAELFGIKTFKTLHQLVSTITVKLKDPSEYLAAIKHAFPMGSMTGAPKLEVMKYIHQLEASDRGLFSGSMGYIDADGELDFNVVIRTLFYDEKRQTASIKTGSAITFDADPQAEFEELELKRAALLAAVNGRLG